MVLNQTYAPYFANFPLDTSNTVEMALVIDLVSQNPIPCKVLHWGNVINLMGCFSTPLTQRSSTPLIINLMKDATHPTLSIFNMMEASLLDSIIALLMLPLMNLFQKAPCYISLVFKIYQCYSSHFWDHYLHPNSSAGFSTTSHRSGCLSLHN